MKRTLVGLLVGFLVLAGFGIQQRQYQQQQTRIQDQQAADAQLNAQRDACYEQWGRDVIAALDARATGSASYDKAAAAAAAARVRKDDASDGLFLLVAAAVKTPGGDEARRAALFAAGLEDFVAAKRRLVRLEAARAVAEKTRNQVRTLNPFPRLRCGGDVRRFSAALGLLLVLTQPPSVTGDVLGTVRP